MKRLYKNTKTEFSVIIMSIAAIFIIAISIAPLNSTAQDSLHYSHYEYNRMRRLAEHINSFTHEVVYEKNLRKYKARLESCSKKNTDEYYELFSKYVSLLSEKNYTEAVDLTNKKLKKLKKRNSNYLTLLATLTKIHHKNRNYVKELESYEILIPLNHKKQRWTAKAWNEISVGNIYFNGKFTLRAIYYYKQAIEDFMKVEGKVYYAGLAVCYQNLGISEDKLGNHALAKENFNKGS